ncbi:MAG: hypothetical protein P8Z30_11490 [Acidobacteriota bacterium]
MPEGEICLGFQNCDLPIFDTNFFAPNKTVIGCSVATPKQSIVLTQEQAKENSGRKSANFFRAAEKANDKRFSYLAELIEANARNHIPYPQR